jgi:hypothetical protein
MVGIVEAQIVGIVEAHRNPTNCHDIGPGTLIFLNATQNIGPQKMCAASQILSLN